VRHDPVRNEAERLVSAAIAAVSLAARSLPSSGSRAIATGSNECCVCPVCRMIASMRDPRVEVAERLATGAGDLATAVTGVLRMLAQGAGRARGGSAHADEDYREREGDEFWESMRRRAADAARAAAQASRPSPADDTWRQATSAPATKPMAKKAIAKTVPRQAVSGNAVAQRPAAERPVAKKAVAKKAVAKKAVAKKAVAKKAVKKAPPPGAPERD
jgi:hypothetical protein